MSRRVRPWQAAVLAVLLQLGCSSPPPPQSVAPARVPAAPPDAAAASAQCLERGEAVAQRACVHAWIKRRPGEALLLAEQLVLRAGEVEEAPALALDALEMAPARPEKADVLLAVADAGLAEGDAEVAEEALQGMEAHVQASGDRSLEHQIAPRLAALRAEQERWGDAYVIYERLVREDPKATEPVAGAVRALTGAGKLREIGAFCRGLLADSDSVPARPLQALACVREAIKDPSTLAPPEATEIALGALALMPGLRAKEMAELAPVDVMFPSGMLSECESPPPHEDPKGVFRPDPKVHPMAAAVFMRLAEAEGDPLRRTCWLRHAAHACWVSLGEEPPCADQRSIGLYLQSLAKQDPERARYAVGLLFEKKRSRYLANIKLRKLAEHKRASRELFELHLALAYLFQDNPQLASKDAFTVKYHVEHAEDRFRDAFPARPFPAELLEPSMARYLRRQGRSRAVAPRRVAPGSDWAAYREFTPPD